MRLGGRVAPRRQPMRPETTPRPPREDARGPLQGRRRRVAWADQGISTPLTTWITPFDCITFGMVTVTVLPFTSVT